MNFAQAGVPFIHCLEAPKHMHVSLPWQVSHVSGCVESQLAAGGARDAHGAGIPVQGTAAVPRNQSHWWPYQERAPQQAQQREQIILLCCLTAEKWG